LKGSPWRKKGQRPTPSAASRPMTKGKESRGNLVCPIGEDAHKEPGISSRRSRIKGRVEKKKKRKGDRKKYIFVTWVYKGKKEPEKSGHVGKKPGGL